MLRSLQNTAQKFPPYQLSNLSDIRRLELVEESLLEMEITKCDEKNAYVDYRENLLPELKYLSLNYYWLHFRLSKELPYYPEPSFWSFTKAVSILTKNFKRILESGILNKIEEIRQFLNNYERRKFTKEYIKSMPGHLENSEKKFSLKGSIQSLFIIWGAFIGLSLIFLLSEFFINSRQYFVVDT